MLISTLEAQNSGSNDSDTVLISRMPFRVYTGIRSDCRKPRPLSHPVLAMADMRAGLGK